MPRVAGACLALLLIGGCNARPSPAPMSPSAPAVVAASRAPELPRRSTIHVETAPSHAVSSFSPLRAFGAGIDRLETGTTDALYSPSTLGAVLSAGWGAVSYRLNTELHVEAWHWNPSGTWSDSRGQGYFTGSAAPAAPIEHSFGYPLPRRGFTRNEGTENVGYSRLTDGDPKSFWKSNPYLAPAFTGEDDSAFPQWVVVDLSGALDVDTIVIDWAEPYAKSYRIEYWDGEDALRKPGAGNWHAFPDGAVSAAHSGNATHKLAPAPLKARFVRVSMTQSSETCSAGDKRDKRNCVGYAISEISLGITDRSGVFRDAVRHTPDQSQTATACSSVDPWHTPSDLDSRAGDQSGLDLFFTSGVTRALPAMVPVSVLYGTPEDASAEIGYLEKRGYPLSHVELGEEADGQYMTPEHYAALYLQWASAIHAVDPLLKLGGPAFTSFNEDIPAWADAKGGRSWFTRFLGYLRAHGRLGELAFMSFEHYPYDACHVSWDALYDEPRLIAHVMAAWREDGLPKSVPILVTEVNLAVSTDQSFVENLAGLWLADYLGAFLNAGGEGSYYFHYLPFPLVHDCNESFGTFGMFKTDAAHRIQQPTSQYFAAQLVSREWAEPVDALHTLFPASSEVVDSQGRIVVTAYALARPDGDWALLLINKDPSSARPVHVAFRDSVTGEARSFAGPVTRSSIGADNYRWVPNGADGHADPDGPISTSHEAGGENAAYTLPRASVTVLRGRIQ